MRSMLLGFLAILLSVPSFADGLGHIRGRVTDETGGVLPGVTVD